MVKNAKDRFSRIKAQMILLDHKEKLGDDCSLRSVGGGAPSMKKGRVHKRAWDSCPFPHMIDPAFKTKVRRTTYILNC